MKYQFLSGAFLFLALALRPTNAINCYKCDSRTDDANLETGDSGCAAGTNTNTLDSKDAARNVEYACTTTFYGSGASLTISRGIASSSKWVNNTRNYCTSDADSTTCYCNEEKCNNVAVAGRTLTCYDCQSSNYFDNGCGSKLDSSSKYVRTVSGCNACIKTVSIDSNDLSVRYVRGCARNFAEYDKCFGEEKTSFGRICGCKKDKCNSATAIQSTSAFAAALFLAIVKLLL